VQLTPRYGDAAPVLRFDLDLDEPGSCMLRQRDRLATGLATLDDEQWAAPSRCAEWSVKDVVAHLIGTNRFWAFSISAGLRHEPSTVLTAFDPVATPAQMVDAARSTSAAETLDQFVESNEQLGAAVAAVGEVDNGWDLYAEAPPGHLAICLVVLHALWDGWIHERDIMIRLNRDPVAEPDEIAAALRYGAALGPTFLAAAGSTRRGALEVVADDLDVRFVVDVTDPAVVHDDAAPDGAGRLVGGGVELLEAVSYRAPLDGLIEADDRWMLDGLAQAFDVDG
jgi:uncharacterized protein (TIGR03083 family)